MSVADIYTVDDREYEVTAEATAGLSLAMQEPWWGTRIRWRLRGTRKWHSRTAIDVHPFDGPSIAAIVESLVRSTNA